MQQLSVTPDNFHNQIILSIFIKISKKIKVIYEALVRGAMCKNCISVVGALTYYKRSVSKQ